MMLDAGVDIRNSPHLQVPNRMYSYLKVKEGNVKACLDGMILSCMISLFRRHYNVMCDFFQQ